MLGVFRRLTSYIDWVFTTSALFALLAGGYQLIYPEPSKRSLVIGISLWGFALLWLLTTVCQNNKLWRFRGSRTVRAVFVVISASLFMLLGWTKYNERPAILYPWLSASHGVRLAGSSPLHILVRDYSSDPNSYVMSLSSLHNLSVSVIAPLAFMTAQDGFGYSSCGVVELKAVEEWNNQDSSSQPIGYISLHERFTLLLLSASSRNAWWKGFLAVRKNGDEIEWEAVLTGWAEANRVPHQIAVRETYKDNKKLLELGGDFFEVSPEFLLRYGIPMQEALPFEEEANGERCVELQQQVKSRQDALIPVR